MIFTGVQSKNVPEIWNRVSGFIQSGLAEGEDLLSIIKRLQAKECQLWIAYDAVEIIAACVTEIVTLNHRKVCNVISVGGSRMNEWLDISLPRIEAWAGEQKCSEMRLPEIRKGWARVLKDYTVKKITMEKVL